MNRNLLVHFLIGSAIFFSMACENKETSQSGDSDTTEMKSPEISEGEADMFMIDTSKSEVKWKGKKVTGEHFGTIQLAGGEIAVVNDSVVGGKIVTDMTTIVNIDLEDTAYNQKLVGHLKSEDFFAIESFPESTFEITEVKEGDGGKMMVSGNLTIKGKTNGIEFPADVSVKENKVTAKGTAIVDRTLWDIKYGSGKFFDDLGDKMIYDEIEIEFDVTASK